MEHVPTNRARPTVFNDGRASGKRPYSKNRQWVADGVVVRGNNGTPSQVDGDRRERPLYRGRGRARGAIRSIGRGFKHATVAQPSPLSVSRSFHDDDDDDDVENRQDEEMDEDHAYEVEEPELETQEERERFWQELVRNREVERKLAIAEGKMDDPLVPKRLEDAITMVGTCMDMCPRFERYRRERENNLFELECIPGTKRVDHRRAVKMYERAAGDKTLPSDLRPPAVLRRTLDYLFHDLLPRGGLQKTAAFIRDRSRAVRNDFTMQHETGPIAMECHDRCVRFHILVIHLERNRPGFSCDMEEQQLMNSLQSLKEFYADQRGHYESPNELEMRVYHRLIHIRDQKERSEEIPEHITNHPAFQLTTKFRLHVQSRSAPITKKSALVVDAQGMEIFSELAGVLVEMGNKVMCYLVACILERLFGEGTVDDIEALREGLSLQNIIDGISDPENDDATLESDEADPMLEAPPLRASATQWLDNHVSSRQAPSATVLQDPTSRNGQAAGGLHHSAFSNVPAVVGSNAFGNLASTPRNSAFGGMTSNLNPSDPASNTEWGLPPSNGGPPTSAFGLARPKSAFGNISGPPKSIFGGPTFMTATSKPTSSASLHSFASSGPPTLGGLTPLSSASSSSIFGAGTSVSSPFADSSTPSGPLVFPSGQNDQAGLGSVQPSSIYNSSTQESIVSPTDTSKQASAAGVSAFVPSTTHALNPKAPPYVPFASSSMNGTVHADDSGIVASANLPLESDPQRFPGALPSNGGVNFSALTPQSSFETPSVTKSSDREHSSAPSSFARSAPLATPSSLPKIITNVSDTSTISVPSPREPPPLNKHRVVSLPPTPSVLSASTTFSPSQPPSALLQTLPSGSLSPLLLSTPTTSRPLKAVPSVILEPSSATQEVSSPIKPSPIKGKQKAVDLEGQAIDLCRKGWLVKKCFHRWLGRAIDRAEWEEACRQSEIYRQTLQLQQSSTTTSSDKKRHVEVSSTSESPIRKRPRKRVSSVYQPPRTDSQLAQRLKESQEENQRRWARGSFLEALRDHVRRLSNFLPFSDWRAWLSMNPENDGTAIWLERKFDVPASGEWVSESVFSVALFEDRRSPPSPGIIIFECTPLKGVSDEIEMKYRLLDDCSRMRDIAQALPSNRHFVPSLLIISWTVDERLDNPELKEMVTKLERQDIIAGHFKLSLTSDVKHLDDKFREALMSLNLDVEGRLVEVLPLRGLLPLFETTWEDFVADCIELVSDESQPELPFLGMILDAAVELMNALGQLISTVLCMPFKPFSNPDSHNITDSESTFDTVMRWLTSASVDATAAAQDLQIHRMMGKAFPMEAFLLGAYQLILHHINDGDMDIMVALLKTDVASIGQRFKDKKVVLFSNLRNAHTLRRLRTPKGRSPSEDSTNTSTPVGLHGSRSSFDQFSAEDSLMADSCGSPTPSMVSAATAAEKKPIVTVAMLKELTRKVKGRYSL